MRVFGLAYIVLARTVESYTFALFTSKNCHPCSVTDHQFDQLAVDFPRLKFRKHELYEDQSIQAFREHNIKTIPSILLFSQGAESNRYTSRKKMYRDVRRACMQLPTGPKPSTTKLTQVHQTAARLCRDVYDDKHLVSCETYVHHPPTDFQCSITLEGDILFVAVRGTEKKQDWKNNVKCSLLEYPLYSKRQVHVGYLLQWLSVQDEVMFKIDTLLQKYRGTVKSVTFCGHSAGSIAVLAALHFAERSKIDRTKRIDSNAVTFGSPRLGNKHFKRYFEENVSCTRIVLDRDVVTRVPFWGGYVHVGSPIQIRDKEVLYRDTSSWEAALWLARGVVTNHEVGVSDHCMSRYCSYIDNLIGKME